MKAYLVIPALVLICGPTFAAETVNFSSRPSAVKDGQNTTISFSVSAPTDVEVSVLGPNEQVVRHLAAGMLGGKNPPPEPLKAGLSQALQWDGKDDLAKPAGAGPFNVRVQLGMGADLDRFIPSVPDPMSRPTAIGVGADGNVYVLSGRNYTNGVCVYMFVLDRNGKYLRTILPSPSNLKADQVKGLDRLKLPGGQEVPIVYQGYTGDTAPFLSGMRAQQLAVTSQGNIVFASGGNDMWNQAVERYVLTINPDGTTPPQTGFVGPRLGDGCQYGDGLPQQQLAVSPDGKTIYFCGMGVIAAGKRPAKGNDCIGKTSWDSKAAQPDVFIGKPDEPGNDGEHLKQPVSVTCDGQGRILVADSGNGRVAVFSPEGKYLGQTKVDRPRMVCLHPKTGTMYVLTDPVPQGKKGARDAGPFALVKFDKAIDGQEVTRAAFTGIAPALALDAGAEPARLWLANDGLFPVTDSGGKLEIGADVIVAPPGAFSGYPLYMAHDPQRQFLYVGHYEPRVSHNLRTLRIDLKTDKIEPFLTVSSDFALDHDGNVYVLDGIGTNSISRYSPDGKPLPFATGTNKLSIKYRAGFPNVGVKGLAVAPDGDVFAYQDNNMTSPVDVWQFGADGNLKKEKIIKGIPFDSGTGLAVDRAGNIYAGLNLHAPNSFYPEAFGDQIPQLAWYTPYDNKSNWYALPQRKLPDGPPWNRPYLNFYLYQYGSIFKFGPEGGELVSSGKPVAGANPRPANVAADAKEYRNAYLNSVIWLSGAKWEYRGFAICANRTEGWGDPGCSCMSSRFFMDEYERLFVPDVFRCSIGVLDSAGNELTRFGAYGNVDSAGPRSMIPAPAIPLVSPNAVVAGRNKAYIVDRKSRRIAVVNLTWAATGTCEIK